MSPERVCVDIEEQIDGDNVTVGKKISANQRYNHLPMCLNDEASGEKQIYEAQVDRPSMEGIKEHFKKAFRSRRFNYLKTQWNNLSRGAEESYTAFAARTFELLRQCEELPQMRDAGGEERRVPFDFHDARTKIQQNVGEHFRAAIIAIGNKKDMLNMMRNLDETMPQQRKGTADSQEVHPLETKLTKLISQVHKIIERQEQTESVNRITVAQPIPQTAQRQIPQSMRRDTRVCYNCDQPGHIARFCPNLGRGLFERSTAATTLLQRTTVWTTKRSPKTGMRYVQQATRAPMLVRTEQHRTN